MAAKVAAWHTQRDALRRLHGELLDDPVPAPLMSALDRHLPRQAQRSSWMRWGGMAAGVLVAFAAGWLGNAQWSASHAPSTQLAKAPAMREFVHDASIAHVVYAPEKRHPVEVAASEQQHLVQWLSKRLDRPLKVPDLSTLGYTLVGGRLLPGETGARAQFMFEDAAGERVTLYIGTLDAGPPRRHRARNRLPLRLRRPGAELLLGRPGLRLCRCGQAAARGFAQTRDPGLPRFVVSPA
jgi:anti-sigma factor RsiW